MKERIFGCFYNYGQLGLPKEFFEWYKDNEIPADKLEDYPELKDTNYPAALAGEFVGNCRMYGRTHAEDLLCRYFEEEDSPKAKEVWQSLVDKGIVKQRFSWNGKREDILRAIAPQLTYVYPQYVAKIENEEAYTPGSCAPIDYFIARKYEEIDGNINQQALDSEICDFLSPDQKAILSWIKKLSNIMGGPYGDGVSYNYGGVTMRWNGHATLEKIEIDLGSKTIIIGEKTFTYSMSDNESQTLKALYENLCRLIDTEEFQRILERTVS